MTTPRQQKILTYIGEYIEVKHFAPSIREIAKYFGCAVTTVAQHLAALERHGAITRVPNIARGIHIRTSVRIGR